MCACVSLEGLSSDPRRRPTAAADGAPKRHSSDQHIDWSFASIDRKAFALIGLVTWMK